MNKQVNEDIEYIIWRELITAFPKRKYPLNPLKEYIKEIIKEK